MMVNGFIKALLVIKHEHFVKMTEIEDKKNLVASINQEDDLGDVFEQRGADISKLFVFEITTS